MEIQKVKMYKALTCHLDDSVTDISKKLKELKDRKIFVVDSDGVLKGIVTSTDLTYNVLAEGKNSDEVSAKDVMVSDVKAVDINKNIEHALAIMNDLKTFNCPVVDNGKILGLVSYHDLVGHVLSALE